VRDRDRQAAIEHVRARLREVGNLVFHPTQYPRPNEIARIFQQHSFAQTTAAEIASGIASEAAVKRLILKTWLNADVEARCTLLDGVIAYLWRTPTALPYGHEFRQVIIAALEDYMAMVSKKRKRKAVRNFNRDYAIAVLVRELQEFGFPPTRNREASEERQRDSGCSIVAAVLAEGILDTEIIKFNQPGLNLTESGVAKIWERVCKKEPNFKRPK
jgi:hypothetical protein